MSTSIAPFIPPFTGFSYHPHQAEGIEWMLNREREGAPMVRGGILADEMGLGKTYMTLGMLLNDPRLHSQPNRVNTLLLVPPVLQPQWAESLQKAGITTLVLQPSSKSKKGDVGAEEGGWSWKHYAGARPNMAVFLSTYQRAANNINTLETLPFDRVVCDEGHVFRNGYSTALFRALIRIAAPQRWILTGTPIQNSVADFGNLLKFLGMGSDVRLTLKVEDIAAEVLLRRTVGDVREAVPTMPTEAPLHVVHPVAFPMGGEEERVYNALVGRYEHAREVNAKASIILELYLRICQYCTHPAIYVDAMKAKYGAGYTRTAWEDTASKFGAFTEFMTTTAAAPTIVFTTFKKEMDMAEATLTGLGYRCWTIGGGMTDAAREAVTSESKEFVEKAGPAGQKAAILVQIVAGGAGLNLQHCNRVVFLSSHWNPAVVDQAIARAYRMGQTSRVSVHHFLMADDAALNLDRYKASMHGSKRSVALAVHSKLYCDSAVSAGRVLGELDSSAGAHTAAYAAALDTATAAAAAIALVSGGAEDPPTRPLPPPLLVDDAEDPVAC